MPNRTPTSGINMVPTYEANYYRYLIANGIGDKKDRPSSDWKTTKKTIGFQPATTRQTKKTILIINRRRFIVDGSTKNTFVSYSG